MTIRDTDYALASRSPCACSHRNASDLASAPAYQQPLSLNLGKMQGFVGRKKPKPPKVSSGLPEPATPIPSRRTSPTAASEEAESSPSQLASWELEASREPSSYELFIWLRSLPLERGLGIGESTLATVGCLWTRAPELPMMLIC